MLQKMKGYGQNPWKIRLNQDDVAGLSYTQTLPSDSRGIIDSCTKVFCCVAPHPTPLPAGEGVCRETCAMPLLPLPPGEGWGEGGNQYNLRLFSAPRIFWTTLVLDSRFRGNDGKRRSDHHAFPVGYFTPNALHQAAKQLRTLMVLWPATVTGLPTTPWRQPWSSITTPNWTNALIPRLAQKAVLLKPPTAR